ncbi:hypothetical protein FACS18949_04980 [Clostridia bacterium]|nr:hypothetical protein FACS189425_03860 [Clostridia bacterium]GHV32814.1 hypothetical protein FACS18949_04980 [Clostridia bacterium]
MLKKDNYALVFTLLFAVIAAIIFVAVIFTPPLTGVADQNDFGRVMYGLAHKDTAHFNNVEKFNFVTTEYAFTPFPHERLFYKSLSEVYFIYAARLVSKALGFEYFRLGVIALLAGGAYIALMSYIYRAVMPGPPLLRILLGAIMLFVFFDGNWLMWFYSLYGEPYSIIGFAWVTAAFLYVCRRRTVTWFGAAALVLGSLFLTGSKVQGIVFLAVCSALIVYLLFKRPSAAKRAVLIAAIPLVILYSVQIYLSIGARYNGATVYHAVMFGLLVDAPDKEQALDDLGLTHELLPDVGKHAYLAEDEYVFAPPYSEKLTLEFYDKVSNVTLVKYYLTHPSALAAGLNFLSSKSLVTATSHGIHTEELPKTTVHHRFTLWSDLRRSLPKNFWFLLAVLLAALAASAVCLKRGGKLGFAVMLWALLAMGVLQFPLPYIFNGHADTTKQLMLFNYIFDAAAAVILYALCYGAYHIFSSSSKTRAVVIASPKAR